MKHSAIHNFTRDITLKYSSNSQETPIMYYCKAVCECACEFVRLHELTD